MLQSSSSGQEACFMLQNFTRNCSAQQGAFSNYF
jgi:hypothetical protein